MYETILWFNETLSNMFLYCGILMNFEGYDVNTKTTVHTRPTLLSVPVWQLCKFLKLEVALVQANVWL